MRLIIGLGNPGEEYENTRHNIGFEIVDMIARKDDAKFSFEKKFNAEVAKAKLNGPLRQGSSEASKLVMLIKPYTFVNKSGEAVKKAKLFYKAKNEGIVVIHDDLDIEFGNFKMSFGKDSGGHRGVQSIIEYLKTNKFWRLRIGTANKQLTKIRKMRKSAPTPKGRSSDRSVGVGNFVLAKFTPAEQVELKKVAKAALERLGETLR